MWWLIPIGVAGYVIKKVVKNKKKTSSISSKIDSLPSPTTLEQNFMRLKSELSQNRGKKIAIIGQPGAGKSTLLYQLTDGQCTPIPEIGQRTDMTDWSTGLGANLVHRHHGIIFVDVVGTTSSDDKQIYQIGLDSYDLLLNQIKILSPNIVLSADKLFLM